MYCRGLVDCVSHFVCWFGWFALVVWFATTEALFYCLGVVAASDLDVGCVCLYCYLSCGVCGLG